MPRRHWTVTEDRLVRELCGEGATAPEIAAELNRSVSAIEKRRTHLNIRMAGTNRPDVLKRAAVIGYIREGFTIGEIAKQMNVSHPTILSMINRLCAMGIVERESVRTRPMRFRLSSTWTSKDG